MYVLACMYASSVFVIVVRQSTSARDFGGGLAACDHVHDHVILSNRWSVDNWSLHMYISTFIDVANQVYEWKKKKFKIHASSLFWKNLHNK